MAEPTLGELEAILKEISKREEKAGIGIEVLGQEGSALSWRIFLPSTTIFEGFAVTPAIEEMALKYCPSVPGTYLLHTRLSYQWEQTSLKPGFLSERVLNTIIANIAPRLSRVRSVGGTIAEGERGYTLQISERISKLGFNLKGLLKRYTTLSYIGLKALRFMCGEPSWCDRCFSLMMKHLYRDDVVSLEMIDVQCPSIPTWVPDGSNPDIEQKFQEVLLKEIWRIPLYPLFAEKGKFYGNAFNIVFEPEMYGFASVPMLEVNQSWPKSIDIWVHIPPFKIGFEPREGYDQPEYTLRFLERAVAQELGLETTREVDRIWIHTPPSYLKRVIVKANELLPKIESMP